MRMGMDINRVVIIIAMSIVTILNITVKSGVWEGLHLLIFPSRSKTSFGIRWRLILYTNHSLTNFCKDLVAYTTASAANDSLDKSRPLVIASMMIPAFQSSGSYPQLM